MTKAQEQLYKQEVKRIKRQVKALEKRGYDVSKVKIPKTLKGAQNLTLEKIYSKSTYVTETGKRVSGARGREIERARSARKAVRTRSTRKQWKQEQPEYEKGIERQTQGYEERQRRREQEQQPYYPLQEDIILDNLIMLINRLEGADVSWGINRKGTVIERSQVLQQTSENVRHNLLGILNRVIAEEGSNTVARRISQSATDGELNTLIETMLHAYDSDESNAVRAIHASYQELVRIITGVGLSLAETIAWSQQDEEEELFPNA